MRGHNRERELPSWSCEFDSRHPLHSIVPSQLSFLVPGLFEHSHYKNDRAGHAIIHDHLRRLPKRLVSRVSGAAIGLPKLIKPYACPLRAQHARACVAQNRDLTSKRHMQSGLPKRARPKLPCFRRDAWLGYVAGGREAGTAATAPGARPLSSRPHRDRLHECTQRHEAMLFGTPITVPRPPFTLSRGKARSLRCGDERHRDTLRSNDRNTRCSSRDYRDVADHSSEPHSCQAGRGLRVP